MKSKCAAARENERAHRPAEAKPRFLQRSPLPPADLQGDSGLRQGAVGTTPRQARWGATGVLCPQRVPTAGSRRKAPPNGRRQRRPGRPGRRSPGPEVRPAAPPGTAVLRGRKWGGCQRLREPQSSRRRKRVWRPGGMAGLELLSDQGYRVDGRRAGELRKIQARMGVFAQADGSAYIEQGNTKALAVVYGPHEASGRPTGAGGRRTPPFTQHIFRAGSIGVKAKVLAPRCTVAPVRCALHSLPFLKAPGAPHPLVSSPLFGLHCPGDTSAAHGATPRHSSHTLPGLSAPVTSDTNLTSLSHSLSPYWNINSVRTKTLNKTAWF